jgi:hypothetical protein
MHLYNPMLLVHIIQAFSCSSNTLYLYYLAKNILRQHTTTGQSQTEVIEASVLSSQYMSLGRSSILLLSFIGKFILLQT